MFLHRKPQSTALAVFAAILLVSSSHAAPRTPDSDSEVLATVPIRQADVKTSLSADDVLQQVSSRIRQFRLQDDPRQLGLAKGLLQRYLKNGGDLSPALRLARASIHESEHAFTAALADLRAVIEAEPDNAQAWLNRATIERLQGEYEASLASCQKVNQPALSQSCVAITQSLTGNAARSYQRLLLLSRRARNSATRSWYSAMLGDIAVRLGNANSAEKHYRQAIALAPKRSYARRELADLLLSQQRAAEVQSLTATNANSDALLLRLALAKQQQGADFRAEKAELLARYEAAQRRSNNTHLRDQALFQLKLNNEPANALLLAQTNWQSQREATDLLLLLEAAVAANDRDTINAVQQWQQDHQLEDMRLTRLLRAAQ